MASTVDFNTIGFFNSIMPLNQTNWASYFGPIIPDGVIAGVGEEMDVYADSSGMHVFVKTGECRVRSHMGILSEIATLDVAPADPSYSRADLVVARVTYGNPSTMELAIKTGVPSADWPWNPPEPTKIAGDVWEMPLADIFVANGSTTITNDNINTIPYRYVYNPSENPSFLDIVEWDNATPYFFARNLHEYRFTNLQMYPMRIILPDNPPKSFHATVSFTSTPNSWNVLFYDEMGYYERTDVKTYGASLTQTNKRYHLDIFWDGEYYWCNAMAA